MATTVKQKRSKKTASARTDADKREKRKGADAANGCLAKTKAPAGAKKKKAERDALAARRALVDSIRGKYAWIPYSSEDFNRDKRREIALEDRA